MTNSVYFDPAVGGDGSTVTDDNNASTGLGKGGHRVRFVPAMGQVVAVAQFVVDQAEDASDSAAAAQASAQDASDSADAAAASAASAASSAATITSTSTSSLTVGTGSKTFVTQAGKQYAAGQFLTAVSSASPSNYMFGQVTSYSGTSLILNSLSFGGSGTFASWNISLSGIKGDQGAAGSLSGTATGSIEELKGANIASAATLDLSNTDGNFVHVTGTTGITAITLAQGAERTVVFDGVLTLTHSASLLLPGAQNIVTAAGDRMIVRGEGSGNVRAINYTRALAAVPNQAKSADIASAATLDLDAATGEFVHVTGTTGVTAITLASGRQRTVVFDAALTLTHSSSLLLPGTANITTAAGDRAVFIGDDSSVVRCIFYSRADGTPILSTPTAGNVKSLGVFNLSSLASLDITSLLTSTYKRYLIRGLRVVPSAEALLLVRTSTNNGTSFDSGSSDYTYGLDSVTGVGSSAPDGSSGNGSIRMNSTAASHAITSTNSYATDIGASFDLEIIDPSASKYCSVIWSLSGSRTGSISVWTAGNGFRKSTTPVNAVQLLFSTGTLLSGAVEVFAFV